MAGMTITTASIMLRYAEEWQGAILKGSHKPALMVVHDLCRRFSCIDSATVGFAAGLYYGKRIEREHNRFMVTKKPGTPSTVTRA